MKISTRKEVREIQLESQTRTFTSRVLITRPRSPSPFLPPFEVLRRIFFLETYMYPFQNGPILLHSSLHLAVESGKLVTNASPV